MSLSLAQQALIHNLPTLVADLDALDVVDHLLATDPPCLTITDYESLVTVARQNGRSAGVRFLISCLLRRHQSTETIPAVCNALRSGYKHLANLLERTYQNLLERKLSNHHPASIASDSKAKSTDYGLVEPVETSCQTMNHEFNVSEMKNRGVGKLELDILLEIISLISSHPLACMDWQILLEQLGVHLPDVVSSRSQSDNASCPPSDFDFLQAGSCLKRGLFQFFGTGLMRVLENRGSPLKQPIHLANKLQNAKLILKLINHHLIPVLQQLAFWQLAKRVESQAGFLLASVNHVETDIGTIAQSTLCALVRCNCKHNPNQFGNQNPDALSNLVFPRHENQFAVAMGYLSSCIEPLFKHTLIQFDWPFLLHELHVCSSCILQILMATIPTSSTTTPVSNSQLCHQHHYQGLMTYFHVTLMNTLCQRLDKLDPQLKSDNDNDDDSFVKSCVAYVIHSHLLLALRTLGLNALSDEIEHLALQSLH